MAPVSPRFSAWSRKTEFSTWRAGGLRPKEMLERPRMIWHSGSSRAIRSIASSVHNPSLRSSSLPVQMVKVSGSNIRSAARQAVALAGEIVEPVGDLELALDLLGHALLVDGERDDRGAEAAGELEALGRRGPRHPRN